MITPNRNSPLNRGRVAWWLAAPGLLGPLAWTDLMHRSVITYATGTFANIPVAQRRGYSQCRLQSGATPTLGYLDVGASDITLAMWMRTADISGTSSVILQGYSSISPFPGYGLGISNVSVHKLAYWNGQNTSFCNSASAVDTGNWLHFAVASSGSGAGGITNFYINGKLDNQVTGTTAGQCSAFSGPRLFNTGSSGSDGIPVAMTDMSIWNRQLSAAEVWSLYVDSLTGYQKTLGRQRKVRSRGASAGIRVPWHLFQNKAIGV